MMKSEREKWFSVFVVGLIGTIVGAIGLAMCQLPWSEIVKQVAANPVSLVAAFAALFALISGGWSGRTDGCGWPASASQPRLCRCGHVKRSNGGRA